MSGTLFHGDNLAVMGGMASASVDLIYLDPPFNTKRDFHMPTKEGPKLAFTDKWKWTDASEATFWSLRRKAPKLWGMLVALVELHGRRGTSAYLLFMAERLLVMQRLLKPTGSLYLHCDSTSNAYLRVVLDGVFGVGNFRNQICWKRSASHTGTRGFGAVHDSILVYAAGEETTWNGDGGAADLWEDIPPLNQSARERTGYPTQKPVALLTRIIEASSRPGDMVLDPHAGAGTALVAAELAGRRWAGIDLGGEAVQVAEAQLRSLCPGATYEIVHQVAETNEATR